MAILNDTLIRGALRVIADANIGGNVQAATFNGLPLSGSVGANTIPIRDSNGYVYFNYINTNIGVDNSVTSSSHFLYANSDGWIRKADAATIKTALSIPTAYLASASVSGNTLTINPNSGNAITFTPSFTDKYHTTGSWSGLTYTATANGGAGALAFTLPTDWGNNSLTVNSLGIKYNGTTACGGFGASSNGTLTVESPTAITLEAPGVYVGGVSNNNLVATHKWVEDKGYTTNIGTVTQVKVGNTAYDPSSAGVVILPAYPTTLPANGGNADTVDNEHADAFAHRGVGNNLITAGNEFNFISDNYGGNDGADVWINYTTPSRNNSAKITGYILGNGHGGQLGTIIHSGNIGSQSVNYANSAGNADTLDNHDSSYFYPASNPNSYTSVTETTVTNWGFTKNAGTVTLVRVQAGTGLTSSQNGPQTETLNTTISIASGYKLPTTDEWSSKLDMSDVFGFGDDVMEAFIDGNYPSFIKLVNDGNDNPKFAFDTTNYSVVSGANDGTNWTSITINGVTKTIPSGGGSGTVTSVAAGTGLSISGTASVNPTVNIASGYKLPTTTEWNNKSNKIYRHTITVEGTLDGFYYMFSYISSSSIQVTTPSLLYNLIANNQTITTSVKYKYGVGGMVYDENNDMQYPLLAVGVYKPTKISSKIAFSILPDDWTHWTKEYAVEDDSLRISSDDVEPISNTML